MFFSFILISSRGFFLLREECSVVKYLFIYSVVVYSLKILNREITAIQKVYCIQAKTASNGCTIIVHGGNHIKWGDVDNGKLVTAVR